MTTKKQKLKEWKGTFRIYDDRLRKDMRNTIIICVCIFGIMTILSMVLLFVVIEVAK